MSRFSRFLLPLAFALAFALPPLPVPPAYDPSKPTAVVVAGNQNTESSVLLGPYETLSTSGRFNVSVAAPERRPSPPFPGELNLVPHCSFAEYDQALGRTRPGGGAVHP